MKFTLGSLALVVMLAAPALAGGSNEDCLVAERVCQFQAEVPVIFRVGECIEREGFAFIPVRTNTRTRVQISCAEFIRYERDCEGRQLRTFDTIPADLRVRFIEIIECRDGGAPLEVDQLAPKTWCVNPHRGGYIIALRAVPECFDICDDAGCYTAEVKVTVTAEPFEDCCAKQPEPPNGSPKEKGNNGVGNGLDPQPPGNPPVNDGPGTGPGSPGNSGGAHD